MTKPPKNKIHLILSSLSTKPGVYRFLDENDKVIYVGKAKNLKRRVSSYFNKTPDTAKLRVLVSKIRDIHTVIVYTEWEALLLENSLIKQYKPRYNILLKDDKSYPWIAVSKEIFPKVYATHNPNRSQIEVFGPYASGKYMNTLLRMLFELFPLRHCPHFRKGQRPCLQYQLKRCAAPCAELISQEKYQMNIHQIIEILKGNSNLIIKQLHQEMLASADRWEFEKAQVLKEKIDILTQFKGKSVVVNPEITNLDVFSIVEDEQSAYVNFMRIVEGAVIQLYTIEIAHKLDKSQEDLLFLGMVEILERFGKLNKDILLPFMPETTAGDFTFIIPQRGDKKKLIDLSLRNALTFMAEKNKRRDLVNPERHSLRVLSNLQKDLQMNVLPTHIECFDNSNTQGEEPVAAMVCFINGKPAKKEYRHYNIKTVEGPDDFASMEEVIYRRYQRLLEEQKPLPNLVVIDGGKGQLSAAYKSLQKLELTDKIYMVGIAKRLEDIYRVGDALPLFIDKKSESQKLLQLIRDEVHRFGITHHRQRRAKKSIASKLDAAPGIGKVLSEKLLHEFKSVKRIEAAGEAELAAVIGKSKAAALKQWLLERK